VHPTSCVRAIFPVFYSGERTAVCAGRTVKGEHVDLGDGHGYELITDAAGEVIGMTEWHLDTEGRACGGFLAFRDGPWDPQVTGANYPGPLFEVIDEDPLTIRPAVRCSRCGAHGEIREGRWHQREGS
jgi:hypothetical protein